jgi:hypothetical protein
MLVSLILSLAILCGWLASIVLTVLWFAGVAPVASWSAWAVFGPAIIAAVLGYLLRIFTESAST